MQVLFKMVGRGFVMLCLMISAFCMGGCGSSYSAMKKTTPYLEDTAKVVYRDASLKINLAVVDVVQDEVNGLMRVRAKLKNLGRGQLNIEVQVKFLDKSQMEVGPTPMQPFPLSGGDSRTIETISSARDAADYRIFVKLAGR